MLKFWKREETVSRADHERIVMGWQEDLRETHARLNREIAELKANRDDDHRVIMKLAVAKSVLQARLGEIADQETAGANATVKRMARIARGEDAHAREKQAAE